MIPSFFCSNGCCMRRSAADKYIGIAEATLNP
jgi:hypothetical protein